MSVCNKDTGDEILILGRHPGTPFATASLGTIGRERHTFDVTLMADRHHHVFTLNEVFILNFVNRLRYACSARRRKFIPDCSEFFANDRKNASA